ncbi:ABC transporter permease [Clostridium sp. AF32-12BH]|uniref:ABC transporter permease n=1 Tax=Clostridium sp. AF32-12BH TaxID=2292006 RepID=UPI001FA98A9F|nr:ABC transporter permease [Clostridium sp. AF32-12BH]
MSVVRIDRTSHPLLRYTVRRMMSLIPVLIGVTLLTYGLMYLSPQDPVEMMLQGQGTAPDPEVVEAMQHQLGLDRPFLVQYFDWLYRFVCGDMGVSYLDGAPVVGKLLSALPNTLKLTAASVLVTVLFSVPLGVLTAVKQGKTADILVRFFSFIGNSLPNFIVSLLLLYVLALKLGWFPILSTDSWDSLVLPTLALAIPMTGKYIRQVRAAVLEQLQKSYVNGAYSRGLHPGMVIFSYVLRNAMTTIITLLSMSVGSLLGGTAAVEVIFSLPGMGYMVTSAVTARDYPVIQAFVVWMSVIYLLINLLTDLFYSYMDPRISAGMEGKS